jgi:hypothetical protein
MKRQKDRPTRSCICTIIPPYIQEAIARNGTPSQRATAQQSLAVDAQLRAQRIAAPSFDVPQTAAAAPCKNRSVYTANNTNVVPGTLLRSEGQPPNGDLEIDEAYDGLGASFDLFLDIYGRKSIDDACRQLIATAHYGDRYNNAVWDGSQMVFGDGDPTIFNRFTLIDITGHELTHGVTGATAGLFYNGQSGALNESISDVFGSLIKQRSLGQAAAEADWLIGAGAWAANINGVAFRSMKAPGTAYHDPLLKHDLRPDGKDPQPAHMRDYVNTELDNGGVHVNSGIPNKAFYLVATALGGNAWHVAGNVWYRTLLDSRLSATARFEDFARLTADNAERLYGAFVRGVVVQAWHEVGLLIAHDQRARRIGAPKAAGSPSSVVNNSTGGINVIYREGNGHLHELWMGWEGEGWGDLTVSPEPDAELASEIASVYLDSATQQPIVPYRGNNGHVQSIYYIPGGAGHDRLSETAHSPKAGSKAVPAGYYTPATNTHHLVYRGNDNRLHVLFSTNGGIVQYEGQSLHQMAPGSPLAKGNPSAYVDTDSGFNSVVYRGNDNDIHRFYWGTGPVEYENLSAWGVAQAPKAAGDPVSYYISSHPILGTSEVSRHVNQVTYRDVHNHICELWWRGEERVNHWDVTAATEGAPPAASDPVAYYSAATNTKHIFYRSADSHLHELWWVPGGSLPKHADITNQTFAAPALDKPTAFSMESAKSQHIFYRGTDNYIHEIRMFLGK